jgi:hypothetical protein
MRSSDVTLFDCRMANEMQNKATACSEQNGSGTPLLAFKAKSRSAISCDWPRRYGGKVIVPLLTD